MLRSEVPRGHPGLKSKETIAGEASSKAKCRVGNWLPSREASGPSLRLARARHHPFDARDPEKRLLAELACFAAAKMLDL